MNFSSVQVFPFRTVRSLAPLAAWWAAREAAAPGSGLGRLGTELLVQARAAPGLLDDDPSLATLFTHAALVETLFTAVIPPAARDTTLSGAIGPFDRQVMYATPPFRRVIVTGGGLLKQPLNLEAAETAFYLTRLAYRHLLEVEYAEANVLAAEENLLFTVADYASGLYRHFKIELDARFLTVEITGERPALTPEDRRELVESRLDLAPWINRLPPDRFTLRGFLVLHLTDVTETQILSTLKNDLLARDVLLASDRLEQLQEQLRALYRQPTLRLGLAGYKPRSGTFETFGQRLGQQTLSQHAEAADPAEANEFRKLFNQLARTAAPLIVPDVATTTAFSPALREQVRALDIRSVVLYPLHYGPDVLGVLELSSPLPNVLMAALGGVEHFLPLFAVAVSRHQAAEWARVQAIVKERFTAIHPALEWRFVEAAEDLLNQQRLGNGAAQLQPIIFPDVYPLYAAVDVRSSSSVRAEAVRSDLSEHLHLANRVLNIAAETQPLPIVEELRYFTRRNLLSLRDGLVAEDEGTILDTLRTEVEPLFEFLRTNTPAARGAIQRYWAAIDPQRGIVNRQRRAFEDSQTRVNERISSMLDVAEAEAQRVFPHYFRKSVTDGVEFDIYVGASLVENHGFDPIILKNLRLWQLRTLIDIARAMVKLKDELPMPLVTTQLLLINSQPLAVRFREDERQFDVDGAWNARYEIIKKRIDKATYLTESGKSERLTQPGAIALVYQQPREAAEYEEYLAYLRAENLLTNVTEHLALEEAQGVRGLHALRVWLADPVTTAPTDADSADSAESAESA